MSNGMKKSKTIHNRQAILLRRGAFTLLEVLVVASVIAMLLSMLLPGLSAARQQAKGVSCQSNIRQLILINQFYADDHQEVYVPGASEFLNNLNRWHGQRNHVGQAFDSSRGPLALYLKTDGQIRQCPSFPAEQIAQESDGFERGNGGYGYNNHYLGVQLARRAGGAVEILDDRTGARVRSVSRPAETLMFTDSAFATDTLIEYSFAEPRYQPTLPTYRAVPSIHFRHRGQANVGWCDGHVSARKMTFTHASPYYKVDPKRFNIGWFGDHDDNRLFDLD